MSGRSLPTRTELFRAQAPVTGQVTYRSGTDEDLINLEFSDYGRDRRFLPGWWIVPSLVSAIAIVGSFLA